MFHLESPGACLACASLLAFAVSHATPPADSPYGGAPAARFGQIRTRTEFDQKAMADTSSNEALLNTHSRIRLGFTANPSEMVEAKVELQDTRFWGSESPAVAANPATASVANSKGVDVLQGYAKLKLGGLQVSVGRQKMSLGAGRFLSTLEWHPYSRAFDGASFNYEMEPGNLTGVAYLVRDTAAPAIEDRLLLAGLYYNHRFNLSLQGDLFAFYDQSRLPSAGAANYDLVYAGQRLAGKFGMFAFEEEFIWQGGEITLGGNKTSMAFQSAARVGAVFGRHKVNLGLDMMSGDDDLADDDAKTYRANYSFAHMYFGWMDYFLANPASGVVDYRLDADVGFFPNPAGAPRLFLKPQYHFFTPQSAPSGTDDPYGQEVDVEMHIGFIPRSNIVLGAALFLPGDGAFRLPGARMAQGQESKPGFFLYFMPVFNF